MLTKKKLIRFLNNTCMYCLIAMSAGMIVGCFIGMINVFLKLV